MGARLDGEMGGAEAERVGDGGVQPEPGVGGEEAVGDGRVVRELEPRLEPVRAEEGSLRERRQARAHDARGVA